MKLHTRPKHFPSTSTAFGVINSTLTLSQHFSSIKAWGSVKVHRAVVLISDCIYKCVCLYLSIVWDLASSSSSWKWASSKCANAPKITHRHYSTVAVSRQCSVHYIKKSKPEGNTAGSSVNVSLSWHPLERVSPPRWAKEKTSPSVTTAECQNMDWAKWAVNGNKVANLFCGVWGGHVSPQHVKYRAQSYCQADRQWKGENN